MIPVSSIKYIGLSKGPPVEQNLCRAILVFLKIYDALVFAQFAYSFFCRGPLLHGY